MSPIKFFLSLIILFSLSNCALKREYMSKVTLRETYYLLKSEGFGQKIYQGKLFVDGEFNFLRNGTQSGASYGYFYIGAERLFIQLKPPLSSEIFILWFRHQQGIMLINPSQKKVFKINFINGVLLDDLPNYFLGLKENEKDWRIGFYSGKYIFSQDEMRGEITSAILNITWRIKELRSAESFPDFPQIDSYEIKVITLPF